MNPWSDFFPLSSNKKKHHKNQMGLDPSPTPSPHSSGSLINLLTIKKLPFLKWVFYLVTCVDPSILCGRECGSEGCRLQKESLLVQARLVLVLLLIQNFPLPIAPLTPGSLTTTVAPQSLLRLETSPFLVLT